MIPLIATATPRDTPKRPATDHLAIMGAGNEPGGALKSDMVAPEQTREQAISESVKRSTEFQKLHPDVDWKGAVIEPTINFTFDLKVRVFIVISPRLPKPPVNL